jgi:hypothetical protein
VADIDPEELARELNISVAAALDALALVDDLKDAPVGEPESPQQGRKSPIERYRRRT